MSGYTFNTRRIAINICKSLYKYIGYSNSPNNLTLVHDDILQILINERDHAKTINGFTIKCDITNNPSVGGIFLQTINAKISLTFGKLIPQVYNVLIQVTPNDVDGYLQIDDKFSQNSSLPPTPVPQNTKPTTSPTDDYDRAMKGV